MDCGSTSELASILEKNFIEKRRSIIVTFCESFSHLILIILLLLGFNISKIIRHDDTKYSTVNLKLPDEIYAVYEALGYKSDTLSSSSSSMSDILRLLDGPLVIPTFDEFILVSEYVQKYNSVTESVYVSQSTVGYSYANIYTRCALHFAPNNELTSELIKYLHQTTTTFRTIKYHVHASEDDAVSYILNHLEERALALVVLNEISLKHVDYTLRFNYSTIPNTNQVINSYFLGFDSSYQKYLISGYMTMQDTVDRWIFDFLNLPSQAIESAKFIGGCTKPYPFLIPFPVASYFSNPFYSNVGFLLGLAMASKSVLTTNFNLSANIIIVVMLMLCPLHLQCQQYTRYHAW